MTPKATKQGSQTVGMIGIREEEKFDPVARINYGWRQFITAGTLIFAVLGHMITHGFSLNDLGAGGNLRRHLAGHLVRD